MGPGKERRRVGLSAARGRGRGGGVALLLRVLGAAGLLDQAEESRFDTNVLVEGQVEGEGDLDLTVHNSDGVSGTPAAHSCTRPASA